MKVLHISSSDIQGGASIAAWRLHRALIKSGAHSKMLVLNKVSADATVESVRNETEPGSLLAAAGDAIQQVYCTGNRTGLTNTHFSQTFEGVDLSEHPLVQEANVIHLHWVATFQTARSIQTLFATGKPVVWTMHDFGAFTGGCHFPAGCLNFQSDCAECPQLLENPFQLPAAVLRDKMLLWPKDAFHLLTPSHWMAGRVNESALFGGNSRSTSIIPNAVDTELFRPRLKKEARTALGLSSDCLYLLCGSAELEEKRKGFEVLGRVLASISSKSMLSHQYQLLLVGGDIPRSLSSLSATTLGRLKTPEEMALAFAAADLFVMPSIEDQLPSMMLEAFACGIPVVAFDVGAIGEALEDEVHGRLVPVGDEREMERCLVSLLNDKNLRERMGANARALMEQRYTYEAVGKAHIRLYQDILDSHTDRPVPLLQEFPLQTPPPVTGFGPELDSLLPRLAVYCMQRQTEEFRKRSLKAKTQLQAQAKEIQYLHSELEKRLRVIEVLDAYRQSVESKRARTTRKFREGLSKWGSSFQFRWQTLTAKATRIFRVNNWWDSKIPPLLAVIYLECLRFDSGLLNGAAIIAGFLFTIACVAAYGHVINDIFDITLDAKSGSPNAATNLSIGARWALLGGLFTAGFIPLFIMRSAPVTFWMVALNYLLPTLYSIPKIRLKERGLLGVIADAAGSHVTPTLIALCLFESGHFRIPESSAFKYLIVLTACASGIKGILHHQIIDSERDRRSGTKTFVTQPSALQLWNFLPYYNLLVELPLAAALVISIFPFCPLALAAFIGYCTFESVKFLRKFKFSLTSDNKFIRPNIPFLNELFYIFWLPFAALLQLAIGEFAWLGIVMIHGVLFYSIIRVAMKDMAVTIRVK